jgi:3D-(3,5/4)-trihydroxycyclohexane-1,2-dione acylhydrolase (decyclizing)
MGESVRLTVAQATVEFLAAQFSERDGVRQRLFAGCLGIFGHGIVAGIGLALLQEELRASGAGVAADLPYVLARNEQAMVHTAVGYAKQKDRLQTWVCTASVGPGSTNMLTGAALATINRIPVLLLPSGTFATRVSAPVSRSSRRRMPVKSRSTTPSVPTRASSTRSYAPSSCPPRCCRPCACSPTRSRRAR